MKPLRRQPQQEREEEEQTGRTGRGGSRSPAKPRRRGAGGGGLGRSERRGGDADADAAEGQQGGRQRSAERRRGGGMVEEMEKVFRLMRATACASHPPPSLCLSWPLPFPLHFHAYFLLQAGMVEEMEKVFRLMRAIGVRLTPTTFPPSFLASPFSSPLPCILSTAGRYGGGDGEGVSADESIGVRPNTHHLPSLFPGLVPFPLTSMDTFYCRPVWWRRWEKVFRLMRAIACASHPPPSLPLSWPLPFPLHFHGYLSTAGRIWVAEMEKVFSADESHRRAASHPPPSLPLSWPHPFSSPLPWIRSTAGRYGGGDGEGVSADESHRRAPHTPPPSSVFLGLIPFPLHFHAYFLLQAGMVEEMEKPKQILRLLKQMQSMPLATRKRKNNSALKQQQQQASSSSGSGDSSSARSRLLAAAAVAFASAVEIKEMEWCLLLLHPLTTTPSSGPTLSSPSSTSSPSTSPASSPLPRPAPPPRPHPSPCHLADPRGCKHGWGRGAEAWGWCRQQWRHNARAGMLSHMEALFMGGSGHGMGAWGDWGWVQVAWDSMPVAWGWVRWGQGESMGMAAAGDGMGAGRMGAGAWVGVNSAWGERGGGGHWRWEDGGNGGHGGGIGGRMMGGGDDCRRDHGEKNHGWGDDGGRADMGREGGEVMGGEWRGIKGMGSFLIPLPSLIQFTSPPRGRHRLVLSSSACNAMAEAYAAVASPGGVRRVMAYMLRHGVARNETTIAALLSACAAAADVAGMEAALQRAVRRGMLETTPAGAYVAPGGAVRSLPAGAYVAAAQAFGTAGKVGRMREMLGIARQVGQAGQVGQVGQVGEAGVVQSHLGNDSGGGKGMRVGESRSGSELGGIGGGMGGRGEWFLDGEKRPWAAAEEVERECYLTAIDAFLASADNDDDAGDSCSGGLADTWRKREGEGGAAGNRWSEADSPAAASAIGSAAGATEEPPALGRAEALLEEMHGRGMCADMATYSAVLAARGHGAVVEGAAEEVLEVEAWGMSEGAVCAAALLLLLAQAQAQAQARAETDRKNTPTQVECMSSDATAAPASALPTATAATASAASAESHLLLHWLCSLQAGRFRPLVCFLGLSPVEGGMTRDLTLDGGLESRGVTFELTQKSLEGGLESRGVGQQEVVGRFGSQGSGEERRQQLTGSDASSAQEKALFHDLRKLLRSVQGSAHPASLRPLFASLAAALCRFGRLRRACLVLEEARRFGTYPTPPSLPVPSLAGPVWSLDLHLYRGPVAVLALAVWLEELCWKISKAEKEARDGLVGRLGRRETRKASIERRY
ncbi:unnamed protein product [Closterium sp. Naga37s-1]|nr:unnamed protein product [Closterium sp. Naga37s-1]